MTYEQGVDIVVVNYRTEPDLQRFISTLGRHSPKLPFSLTVVDVGAEADFVSELATFPEGRRFHFQENTGFAKACNFASTLGHREVVAFFNADVAFTDRSSIDACVETLLADSDMGVLGPKQVNDDGRITHAGIFGSFEAPKIRGWQQVDTGQYPDTEPAVSVSGSAYFVKRACWDELTRCDAYLDVAPRAMGAFLPTGHYYEETWCSYHAQAHGWTVAYYGGTTLIHQWHKASPVGGWAEQQMKESQRYFREACAHHGIPCD